MSALRVLRMIGLIAAVCAAVVLLTVPSHAVVCNNPRVTATDIGYGNYNPASATPTTANGTITAKCNGNSNTLPPFTIAMSAGNSGSYSPRSMAFGLILLGYNLYTTAGYATVWGDGTGSTVIVSSSGGTNSQAFTVYGRIPINQYIAAGAYIDTITVMMTY